MNVNEEKRLESWKEIGGYLQRNAVTARRWEKEEGLPVHRHSHKSRSSVYAYPSEIDAWRQNRRVVVEARPVRPWYRLLAMTMTVFLCIMMAGSGIPAASAQGSKQLLRQVWSGQAIDGYLAPSPDDRHAVFTDWSDGHLAVRDLRTGTNRALTSGGYRDGHPEHAVFSSDGREIAYTWMNYQTGTAELRIVPIAGGNPRTAYQNDDTVYLCPVGWTPDGKQVLAGRVTKARTGQIAMISLQDESARVLKSFSWEDPGRISLSPDGRYVAYSAPISGGGQEIFLLPVDGGREVNITQSRAIDWWPVWSPDGSRVLFLSDRTGSISLWSVPVESGRANGPAALLKQDIGFIDALGISRNGNYYFNAGSLGRRNVYVAELDSGLKAAKAPAVGVGHYINANGGGAFSPDGKYLAYYAFRAPNAVIPGLTLLGIRTLESGEEHEVAMPGLLVRVMAPPPRWFPDGRSVLVAAQTRGTAGGLYKVDLASGHAELLLDLRTTAPAQAFADLAADGKAIFYVRRGPERSMQLLRFDLESRGETEMKRAPKGQELTSAAVSPHGDRVAYGIYDVPSKQTTLVMMPVGGGEPHEVYRAANWQNGGRFSLAWSRDGRYLIFARPDGGGPTPSSPQNLWRVPVSGGEPEKLGISGESIFYPQMSPDGRRIAFTGRENNAQEVWALENFLPRRVAAK